jgi:hypothetical protein
MSPLISPTGGAHSGHRFGTLINCMDGRVQDSVSHWLKVHHQLDYLDTITEVGPNKLLAEGGPEVIVPLRRKVEISIHVHKSSLVALVGHYDCSGNPSGRKEQIVQIKQGMELIRLWKLPVTVIGLWVNEQGAVEPVA